MNEAEKAKDSEREKNIPTVEEMKEKALEIAKSIPNLNEKHQFMVETRGNVIEFSIIIEMCFNQLITSTGKEMFFDHENKELHLIKGKRPKEDLPKFRAKARDMEELIEIAFPKLDDVSKSNLGDAFNKFETIRDIFAHVPVNWHSTQLEFNDDDPAHKHFFKPEHKRKNVLYALSEFMGLHKWIIDVILAYNRKILLKKEILSVIFLGKSQSEIQVEAKKLKEKNETAN